MLAVFLPFSSSFPPAMAEPYVTEEKKDVEAGQVVTDVLGISGEEGGFKTPGTLQRRMKNRHVRVPAIQIVTRF